MGRSVLVASKFWILLELFAAVGAFMLPIACQKSTHTIDLGDGFEVVEVEDPDPEQDKDLNLPKLCNPNGKVGAQLTQCYEFNEKYYRKFEEEAKAREPWFNFTPDSWLSSTEIEDKYVVPVTKVDTAIKRLEDAAAIELSLVEVYELTNKKIAFQQRKPYLVRGLSYYKDNGKFSVFEKNHSIFVRHDSQGVPKHDEERSPVIIWLNYKPEKVYIDCQLSE